MRPVQRSEILDYVTYTDGREALRAAVLAAKRPRRLHVGRYLTFLFENRDTVRYQVQEMMRVEHLVREADIQHELDTYNELLGGPGELGCTLLIEIDDASGRGEKLVAWQGLNGHLYLELADGTRVRPTWDERQVGDDRLSSVQYLKFDVGGATPVAIGCDFPAEDVRGRSALTDEQRAALAADLADA
ncbi:MAG: DUF3501 family protein [Myxococcales bacterium]|nr:DUF3501 family protein [Myxococcales bacterium]